MVPTWLTVNSWIAIAVALLSAVWIPYDMYVRGYRQHMWMMETVWPLTALYLGPVAVWTYYRWGRPNSGKWQEKHGGPTEKSFPATTAVGATHCGAACMLAHFAGVWFVFLLGLTIFGLSVWAMMLVIFPLTFAFMAVSEYFHKSMSGISLGTGLAAVLVAAAVSSTAYEVGMFGWMAVMQLVLFPINDLPPVTLAYWFLMQIGFVIGFLTSYPAEWWLVQRGFKESM